MEFRVKEADVVQMVMGYLRDQGHHEALCSLALETDSGFGAMGTDLLYLQRLVLQGRWDGAERFLGTIGDSLLDATLVAKMSFAVKKQKYLELLSWQGGGVQRMIYPPWRPGASEGQEGQKGKGAPGEGEKGVKGPYEGLGEGGEDVELAVLLQHLNALKGLCSTSEFNALCALLTLERLDSHPDYANWSVQQGRWGCFNALRGVLWRVLPGQNDDAYAIANGGNGSAKGDVGDAGAAWAGATGLMRMVSMSLSYQAAVDPSQAFREHGTWDQGGRYDAELGYLVPHMEGTGAGARAGAGTGAGAGAGAGAGTGVRTRAGDGSERVLEPMGYMGSPTSATTTTTTLAELSGGSNGGPDILPTPRQPATPPPALSFAPSPAPMPIPAADFISVPSVPSVPWDSKGHTEERERERESVVVDGDGEYVVVALPDREAEAQVGRLGVGGRLVYTPREPVAWTVGQAGEDGVGEGSESAGMQRTLVARQGVQGAHELVQGVQGLGVQSESPESRGEPSAFTVDVGGQKVRAMPPALKRRMQAEREAEERRQLEADDARERERAGSRGRSRSSSRASASSSAIPAPRPTSAHRARVGMGGVGGGGEEVRRSQSSGGVRRSGERLSVGGKAPAPGAPGAPVARGARPHNEETGLGERGRGMGGMDLSRAHPAEPPQEQEREQVREQVLRPRLLYESKCPLRCASLLYSSEGRTTLAVGSNGKTVHVLSYGGLGGAGAVVERDLANIHKGSVYALDWNPELGLIASGSNDKSIRLSNPRTGEVSDPLKEHNGTIRTVRFLPPTTGSVPLIASAGAGDFVTRVWDARAGACLRGLTAHPDAVHGLVWLTEQTLLTGCDAGQIIGHDLRSPRAAWSYNLNDLSQPPRKGVCCLSLLPTASGGGMTVVAGCTGGYVMFFDASTGQVHASHQMHQDDVRSVCVEYTHTQQQTLLTASYDGTATVRGISHSSSILLDTPQILSAHADKVLSAIPIPGTPIAGRNSPPMDYLTTGADGKVMLWSSH